MDVGRWDVLVWILLYALLLSFFEEIQNDTHGWFSFYLLLENACMGLFNGLLVRLSSGRHWDMVENASILPLSPKQVWTTSGNWFFNFTTVYSCSSNLREAVELREDVMNLPQIVMDRDPGLQHVSHLTLWSAFLILEEAPSFFTLTCLYVRLLLRFRT